jgi:hypothetical protein
MPTTRDNELIRTFMEKGGKITDPSGRNVSLAELVNGRDALVGARPDDSPVDPESPEAAFQNRVIQFAEACGWLVFHPRISIRSRKGYVDLTMARVREGKGRLLVWELKAIGGKRTADQKEWAAVLEAIGGPVEYRCYRPEDWPTIMEQLR